MTIYILTIFPDMVKAVFEYGVIGRAVKKGVLNIEPIDLRDFATDKHRSVDDKPFGGGPGMVMRVDVVDRALSAIKRNKEEGRRKKVILLSPRGKIFNQRKAEEYSKLDDLILISGRYEGVDERVKEHLADAELSVGEYVLSGGEIPAMTVADAVARLLPGVVGDPESLVNESFSEAGPVALNPRLTSSPDIRRGAVARRGSPSRATRLDFPQYTQPAEYKGWRVPEVLRSGNHRKIAEWREEKVRSLRNRGR